MAFRNLLQKEVDAHDNESKREALQLLKLGAFNKEVKRHFRVVRAFSIAPVIYSAHRQVAALSPGIVSSVT